MKKSTVIITLTIIMVFSTGRAILAQDVNPNGYPSGPHYNLNIIGKKNGFTCPEQEYYLKVISCGCGSHQVGDLVESCDPLDRCEATTTPIYGNVVFVPEDPENGAPIEIYMQSGKGKKAAEIPTLQVIDPCTASFDNDEAVLQLPMNEAGYSVYARALAKPTDNPNMVVSPGLVAVEDENENDLIYLGLVIPGKGFETSDQTFTRMKGKSRAVDITGLFLWSGVVYYLSEPDVYQYTQWVCGIDTTEPPDGILDEYILDETNTGTCPEGYTAVLAYANAYTAEWVFNIGDFVTYLWDVDNNGVKLLQVRFYPNDSSPELAPSNHNTLATKWGRIKAE